MTSDDRLFDEVVRRSGLADIIAPFAVSRMLLSAGIVPPQDVTPEDLARALPAFERGLRTYLRDEDLERGLQELRGLAARHPL